MGDPPIRPSVHRKTSSAFCAGIATAHLDQSPARRRRVSKRAAPRPPPNVVISSAPPLTNAPYGQSGMEVNPSLPSSYWVARGPGMKEAGESPHSRNPPRQNTCATLYTAREQWTDLSVPKSTRCARPGEERTPLALTYTTLATVVFKIENRMPPFKTIYEPISDTCPLPLPSRVESS